MNANHRKLLELNDELSMFLSHSKFFRGCGLSDSHVLAIFMEMNNGSGEQVSTDAVKYTMICKYTLYACSYK